MSRVRIKQFMWIALGTMALAIGVIGIVVPVLPTTPFLLLTSFCYLRGSRSLHNWLLNHRLFGPIIADYVTHRAISRRTKIVALTTLWFSLVLSMIMVQRLYLYGLLTTIGSIASIHILKIQEKPNG